MANAGNTARRAWEFLKGLRLAGPIVLVLWFYTGYKVIKGRYFQDSWVKARDYMRSVNTEC